MSIAVVMLIFMLLFYFHTFSSQDSMYLVNWHFQFEQLYATVNPTLDVDVSELLEEFRGYEEALWLATCGKYGVDPLIPDESNGVTKTPELQLRFRVMKIYSRYAPHKLAEVDRVVQLSVAAGEQSILHRLATKYGPEPHDLERTVRERVVMWFAYYDQLDRLESTEKLLTAFEGHAEALFFRLTEDYGPEPSIGMCYDPREPRARLTRIFEVYDSTQLSRIDYYLVRYAGNFVRLFGTLQRRYGREPRWEEADQPKRRRSLSEANVVKLFEEAEKEARARSQVAAKVNEIVEAASTAQLTVLMPADFQRHPAFVLVRKMVSENDNYTQKQVVQVTEAVFQAYNRLMVPLAEELVKRRFGVVKEASEWLSFLDYLFANERPHDEQRTLRQIVSLLDIEHGDSVHEVALAGGVASFLGSITKDNEKQWMRYLTTVHGMPDEKAIGVRNRRINHYLHYNPGKSVRDAEAYILKTQKLYPIVEEALTATFGEEPAAPPVQIDRVIKVLQRYAPHRLAFIEDVIEAHCLPRDRPEDVIRRICRSYGPELQSTFAQLESLFLDETESRFQLFASESRMREILARRFAASIDTAADIYTIIEQRAAQEASMKLELQLQRIRRQQEELQKMKSQQISQEQEAAALVVQSVVKQEEIQRLRLVEAEAEELEDLEAVAASKLDMWDQSQNVELAEMLHRQRLAEDYGDGLRPISQLMEHEDAVLSAFLAQREMWRRKWLQDERDRDARLEAIILQRKIQSEVDEQQREDALLVLETFSEAREHELLMKERFDVLNKQAVHVLQYNADLQRRRADIRAAGKRIVADVTVHRGLHANCRFHDPNFRTTVAPYAPPPPPDELAVDEQAAPDKREVLTTQVAEYLSRLFSQHEPSRVGTENELLSLYAGKEAQLVIALEQKYNVHHFLEAQTRSKLLLYLKKMAPHLKDEADTILRRFSGQDEAMWRYLTQVYGPAPQLQSDEMRLYLKNRLVRYLRTNAPHLLLDADLMVDQCEDNGDSMFSKLTSEYGPESKDVARDLLERKLRAFYKRRQMHRSLESVSILAQRFLGRERLLRKLLLEKFGASFDSEVPDTEELAL